MGVGPLQFFGFRKGSVSPTVPFLIMQKRGRRRPRRTLPYI